MAVPSSGVSQNGMPRFPNFKVHKMLGRGSYGKVYKVERDSDKQLYALKEADLGSMSQAERADAVNEVRLLVSISHHNVVWTGRPYSYSSDMWSLGTVLYEMMTFRTPMEGQSLVDLRNRIVCGRFAPVASGRYSQELTSLCHSLLSTEPQKRVGKRQPIGHDFFVPRDLKQLPKRLPPPSYDSDAVQPVVAAAAPVVQHAPPSCSGPVPSTKPPIAMPGARPVSKAAPGPGSRPSSRENSRALYPAEARLNSDNRKGQVPLPPNIPRVPSSGLSAASAAAAAAAAAVAAYQQCWAPSAQPAVFNAPRVVPPYRRASIS